MASSSSSLLLLLSCNFARTILWQVNAMIIVPAAAAIAAAHAIGVDDDEDDVKDVNDVASPLPIRAKGRARAVS